MIRGLRDPLLSLSQCFFLSSHSSSLLVSVRENLRRIAENKWSLGWNLWPIRYTNWAIATPRGDGRVSSSQLLSHHPSLSPREDSPTPPRCLSVCSGPVSARLFRLHHRISLHLQMSFVPPQLLLICARTFKPLGSAQVACHSALIPKLYLYEPEVSHRVQI